MISVRVCMRNTKEPPKRTPMVLRTDVDDSETDPVLTDRAEIARFELPAGTGRVLVSGVERYYGRLNGEIRVDLWSLTESGNDSAGMPGEFPAGSNAYGGMRTRAVRVGNREVLTDGEGYLVNPVDWSEGFARAQAVLEGLVLDAAHWEVIRVLRQHYARHGTRMAVGSMIRHFRVAWGAEKGNNRYLHKLLPRGGPQKQGNRLAGLLRIKGEH